MGQTVTKQIIPLDMSARPVYMAEVAEIAHQIETQVVACAKERELIRSEFATDPATVTLTSCTASYKYYGGHYETYALLQSRFKNKVKSMELTTGVYSDSYDDIMFNPPVIYFYENSTIKVIV